jgi:hypothetical protein
MKFYLSIFTVLLLMSGCQTPEAQPVFKSVYQLSLGGLTKKTARLNGLIAFENPADKKSYTLSSLMTDIEINGKDAGTYVYNNSLAIKPGSEFKVPLSYGFDTGKILPDGDLPEMSYAIRLKGFIILLDEKGEKQKIAFDHTETVKPVILKQERRENREDKRTERKMLRDAKKLEKSLERREKKQD